MKKLIIEVPFEGNVRSHVLGRPLTFRQLNFSQFLYNGGLRPFELLAFFEQNFTLHSSITIAKRYIKYTLIREK